MRGNERRRSPPRGRDDRRFSGPPPPGGGPGGGGWDRRRPRSMSPPDRFRRSPPGKRFRRDDYDDYDRQGSRFDRGDGYGGGGWRGGPPRGGPGYDDRYDDRGPQPRGPLTFVEFVRDLPPHIGPEEANDEYRRYMAGWWGDAIKAEFEERKNDPQLRRQFDPREIQKVVERRDELAAKAAAAFAEELEAGGGSVTEGEEAGPGPEGFTDSAADEDGRGEASPPALAPALCWQPAQLAADLALAKQLMARVDKEKRIASNPLAPATATAGEEQQQEGDADGAPEAAPDVDAELSPDEAATKLDQVLLYLWRVHGIDFYGGREYSNPAEAGRGAARRTKRGPKPSAADAEQAAAEAMPVAEAPAAQEAEAAAGVGQADGEASKEAAVEAAAEEGGDAAAAEEGGDAAAAAEPAAKGGADGAAATSPPAPAKSPTAAVAASKQQQGQQGQGGRDGLEEYERRVSGCWRFRMDKGDPLVLPLQKKRVEEELERFVESQIIKIDDNKWGNKLSQKLFMGREFVVKHIRNKHGHVLEAERERIQEEVYWDNFRAFRQEEQRRQEEEQERVMASMGAVAAGGAGRGRGGRGGRGGGVLPLDAAALPLPMMAPIIMPTAGGMAPVILPMDVVMGMGGAAGGRGRGGRGGRGMGGRGGMPGSGPAVLLGAGNMPGAKLDGGGGVREYFDLDNPRNNRAVLDYGDL